MNAEALGQEAYNKILADNYKDAVVLLNRAIDIDPEDDRLYSNRCYCYLELNDITRAKLDAVTLKEKFPDEKNGYFLMGEILLCQNMNKEAEDEFHRAYTLSPTEDTSNRLFEAQMKQILARGHPPDRARKALVQERCVQGALSLLASNEVLLDSCVQGPPMVFSAEEEQHLLSELRRVEMPPVVTAAAAPGNPKPTVLIRKPGAPEKKKDPLMDPANPLKSPSLWVGNLTSLATEARLKKLFGKAGKVKDAFVFEHHAFVNFWDVESAGKAMGLLQGAPFDNKKLIIKYPDRYLPDKK